MLSAACAVLGLIVGLLWRRRAWNRALEAAKKEHKRELYQRVMNGIRMLEE